MSRTVQLAGIVAFTVAMCALAFVVSDVDTYDEMAMYTIVAVGLSLLMGFAGQVSLGQGAFFMIGAYTAAIVTVGVLPSHRDPVGTFPPSSGWSPWLALAAAPVVTAVVAATLGVFILRLRGHYLAFATLALHLILIQVAFAQASFLGSEYGISVVKRLEVSGHAVTGRTHAAVVWAVAGLALVLALNLLRSRAGRSLQAVAASEPAAAAAGINVTTVKLRLFVLAGALAGLAGGLFAFQIQFQSVSPRSLGLILSIQFVVMVAVGGLGNIYGAVAGAIVITYLDEKLRTVGAQESLLGWKLPDAAPVAFSLGVFALILIVVMLFFPRGLVPAVGTVLAAGRRRLRPAAAPRGSAPTSSS